MGDHTALRSVRIGASRTNNGIRFYQWLKPTDVGEKPQILKQGGVNPVGTGLSLHGEHRHLIRRSWALHQR